MAPPPPPTPPPKPKVLDVTPKFLIAAAVILVVLLLGVIIYCLVAKRKDDKNHSNFIKMVYGLKGSEKATVTGRAYDGQLQQRQHNVPAFSQAEHVVSIPKKPIPPQGTTSRPPSRPPLRPPSRPPLSSARQRPPPASHGASLVSSVSKFTYEELAMITNGFSPANILGQGGFGYVYKGILNGEEVAVKQLKPGSGQGESEFQAEVKIISRIHHKHLVSLVGYCTDGNQRMLVYELVPNKTLEFHLHGNGRVVMDWGTRLKIALGSAKGLAYLHEDCHPKIIHRDIKAANILLDFEFEAQVADFGLAKFSFDTHTQVSTRVMGTIGYLAPEYALSGKLTRKLDVYSFGVMLLELITGKRPVDTTCSTDKKLLVDWARPLFKPALQDGSYNKLVDPLLKNNYDPHKMAEMVACAASCVRHSAEDRPEVSQIVRALEGDMSLSPYSSDYELNKQDRIDFMKMAFGSQQDGRDDFTS